MLTIILFSLFAYLTVSRYCTCPTKNNIEEMCTYLQNFGITLNIYIKPKSSENFESLSKIKEMI